MHAGAEKRTLSKFQILMISSLSSLVVVVLCLCINKNFFNIDDAVNEYLPFFTQMGRIWSSGYFPFLTDNMFIGGNAIVELSHAAFTPQAIIASFIAWFSPYKQMAAIFLALFNTSLISASCLVIGNLYCLRQRYSILLSAFCIIQPIYLFIYACSWLNAAMAQAWFMASVATFLLLTRHVSIKNFLLNFFSVAFLFSTCWTYSVLGYAIFALLFMFFHFKKSVRYSTFIILLLGNALALVFAVPLYSEYIYNSDLHTRFSSLANGDNSLVFPWSSEILSFIPTYFDYANWFGYKLCNISLAFSTIFLPLIFFNRNLMKFYKISHEVKFFICLILVYFICSQLPSSMFSMRWPFRYLPFLTFALCLVTSYVLDHADRKNSSTINYVIFVCICCILSIFKVSGEPLYVKMQLLSMILLLFVYFFDKKNYRSPFIYPFFTISTLLIILCATAWTKQILLPAPPLYRNIEFPVDFNRDGYTFTLGNHGYNNSLKPYVSLFFQRAGLYDVRSINGYTPLGYKNWQNSAWQQYDAQKSLDAMLVPVEGADMCRANAWRISTFVLPAKVAKKNLVRLEKCGYHLGIDAADAQPMTYATLPFDMTKGWEKLPPVALPYLEGIIHESHRDALDILTLPSRDAPVRLVFPRLYWHGYRATLNGEELEITPDGSGFLTSVQVPAGATGTLEFSFFPETWRYLWICPLFSLIGAILCCRYVRKSRPSAFWPDRPCTKP